MDRVIDALAFLGTTALIVALMIVVPRLRAWLRKTEPPSSPDR